MRKESTDTRKCEQATHNLGASDYERFVVPEYEMKHRYFTTCKWGKRFSELFLDYGCGTGIASRTLLKIGREVVAFDISQKMVAVTKKICNAPVVVADALNLPFKNGAFSTICITDVLHHILDLEKAFDEIHRCTKETICINEPSTTPSLFPVRLVYTFLQAITHFKKWVYPKPFFPSGPGTKFERSLNPNQLIRLCESHGFKVIEIRFFNDIPFLHHFLNEKIRKYLFAALISTRKGTYVEIIAKRVQTD